MIEIGKQYKFNYPLEYVTLPQYDTYRGQIVTILNENTNYDYEGDKLYDVQAADGWQGVAWESELEPIDVK